MVTTVINEILYPMVLLFVLITSVFNSAISARLFWRLRIEVALLMAIWPLTCIIPVGIELRYVQARMMIGAAPTSMSFRWVNIAVLFVVTVTHLHVLLRSGNGHTKEKKA